MNEVTLAKLHFYSLSQSEVMEKKTFFGGGGGGRGQRFWNLKGLYVKYWYLSCWYHTHSFWRHGQFCKLSFKLFLKTRQSPSAWNTLLIKPIHKSGAQTKCENYRGICFSNHLSKLFTSILNERLESYVESSKILPHNSLDFRKGFRTEDAMFILSPLLDKYAKKWQKTFMRVS